MSRLALILLLGVLPHLAEARLFKLWTPDVLLPLSSVVCNGVVTKLDKLGEQTPNSLSSVEHWKAHIKVLSTYKGQAASEIDLLYDNTFGAVNGPINFSLKEGHRYRFYLNPGPRGAFITALDANIDNRWAVESLDADEPDSSPPLLMKEAQNLADAYFRKFRSDSNDVQSDRYDPYYYVFKNQIRRA